jgi:hypothetical protein
MPFEGRGGYDETCSSIVTLAGSVSHPARHYQTLARSRHTREGGYPREIYELKRMDSRQKTSGMTALEKTSYKVVTTEKEKNYS